MPARDWSRRRAKPWQKRDLAGRVDGLGDAAGRGQSEFRVAGRGESRIALTLSRSANRSRVCQRGRRRGPFHAGRDHAELFAGGIPRRTCFRTSPPQRKPNGGLGIALRLAGARIGCAGAAVRRRVRRGRAGRGSAAPRLGVAEEAQRVPAGVEHRLNLFPGAFRPGLPLRSCWRARPRRDRVASATARAARPTRCCRRRRVPQPSSGSQDEAGRLDGAIRSTPRPGFSEDIERVRRGTWQQSRRGSTRRPAVDRSAR